MLKTFTHLQMLKLWRTRAGLEPSQADCTVEAVEGLDADAIIAPRMRAWYLNLLDTAPAGLLPVADVAAEIPLAVSAGESSAGATADLPRRVRRLLRLRLASWSNAAVPVAPCAVPRACALALNPYCAPGPLAPLCLLSGHSLRLMPAAPADTVVFAPAVVDPGEDTYTLDESLLNEIPDIFNLI